MLTKEEIIEEAKREYDWANENMRTGDESDIFTDGFTRGIEHMVSILVREHLHLSETWI